MLSLAVSNVFQLEMSAWSDSKVVETRKAGHRKLKMMAYSTHYVWILFVSTTCVSLKLTTVKCIKPQLSLNCRDISHYLQSTNLQMFQRFFFLGFKYFNYPLQLTSIFHYPLIWQICLIVLHYKISEDGCPNIFSLQWCQTEESSKSTQKLESESVTWKMKENSQLIN